MSRSPIDGGAPARRAVVRWAARLVRRDWRQHTLIVILLTVAMTVTVLLASAAYNIAPAAGQREFGDATTTFFAGPSDLADAAALTAWLDSLHDGFGTIDTIGHRNVAVPGSLDNVDFRAQDVDGAFSGPLLDIRSGRQPTAGDEAAITNGVADLLSLSVGGTLDLDGVEREVVGIVENPSDLGDEFVLLSPSELAGSDEVIALTDATQREIERFARGDGPMRISGRSSVPEDVMAGVLMLLASTILMLLVALIASASFTVIAQRRLPQLGMLAAIGATQRHIRLSMLATGAITGVIASVVGGVLGVAGWIAVTPLVEPLVNHRVDTANIPWWIVLIAMLLSILAATGAAWWPARAMSRIPTVMALSGRTPRPARPHRSVALAIALLAIGVTSLLVGSDFNHRGPNATETVLLVVGVLAVVAGVLLVSPSVIRLVGHVATSLPIAGRLALRDLSRYQARSSAALAAIGLALGIPAVIVAATAAAENASPLGNLAANQLVIQPEKFDGPIASPDESAEIETGVAQLTDLLGAPAIELDVLQDPDFPAQPGSDRRPSLDLVREIEGGWEYLDKVYVATPELMTVLGVDAASVVGADVVTADDGDLFVFGTAEGGDPRVGEGEPVTDPGTLPDTYTSLPSALFDPAQVAARGWNIVPSGRWLIELSDPIGDEQLDTAIDIATRYGFVIETRQDDGSLNEVRLGAGLVGMLLALGVLAATVGLIRSESANELRALTATGATRRVRRGITAITAGSLAALGAGLGIASAYIGLLAGRVDHLTPLPWFDLALIAVATPAIATVAAWLLAGREPETISRRALD